MNTRLQEEHDTQRRRRLAALPEEFLVLTRPPGEPIDRVFADSRYDDTQHPATLRGVHSTTAAHTGRYVAPYTRTVARPPPP
ncbi:type VI secretion protein IcmF/TssM N-terminal domain-containing protein, partial [Burkholderia pseudomallei]|uniref:type VI secretion protein IcmF/TssM N-terminal domain-containing protein n=1 Tax=Burkholderia pseudomallei TaxID=28450 RepID=UPI00387DC1C8